MTQSHFPIWHLPEEQRPDSLLGLTFDRSTDDAVVYVDLNAFFEFFKSFNMDIVSVNINRPTEAKRRKKNLPDWTLTLVTCQPTTPKRRNELRRSMKKHYGFRRMQTLRFGKKVPGGYETVFALTDPTTERPLP